MHPLKAMSGPEQSRTISPMSNPPPPSHSFAPAGKIPYEILDLVNLQELSVSGNSGMTKESEAIQDRRQKQLPNCVIRY
eukprot:CAMPEP_0205911014 /NCGR_PEP_ID=MMETSP1325-20131115/4849_1 /ASSEMBLY_ACC=CAM_ASM_000708 /TAXON_ID=236786 /ORGANISM="Florenciella sp., Strain RCC1007" /LENGTH=78 /DNA_ID=CAMNT_0053277463 /DNA_START=156 /DNA_END=392 /DNA_ORIENTATION=+